METRFDGNTKCSKILIKKVLNLLFLIFDFINFSLIFKFGVKGKKIRCKYEILECMKYFLSLYIFFFLSINIKLPMFFIQKNIRGMKLQHNEYFSKLNVCYYIELHFSRRISYPPFCVT